VKECRKKNTIRLISRIGKIKSGASFRQSTKQAAKVRDINTPIMTKAIIRKRRCLCIKYIIVGYSEVSLILPQVYIYQGFACSHKFYTGIVDTFKLAGPRVHPERHGYISKHPAERRYLYGCCGMPAL